MVIPVLLYHSISDTRSMLAVSPRDFENQLKYLRKKGYSSITPQELFTYFQKQKFERKKVLITFDDGFLDNFQIAAPLLEKYGFRGIFFIIGSLVGKTAQHCSEDDMKEKLMMNFEQLLELEKRGHIIASHFYSHERLDTLSEKSIVDEFEKNFLLLKRFIAIEDSLRFVAYPKNKVNQTVLGTVGHLGIRMGFGGGNRLAIVSDNPLNIPRLQIFPTDTIFRFLLKLTPFKKFFDIIRA